MRYQVLLGTALLRAGRYEEAYDHFLRADKLPDDSQNAWFSSPVDRYFLLAITCHRLGWAERSLQWFERAVDEVADRRAAPETSRMLRREVEQNYLEGTLVESHWATCAAKAVVLDRRGDEAAAHSAFDRAIELAGTNPQPWIARGEWHLRHGRRSEAESDFVSGFKLNTDHAQPVEIQSFLLSRVSKHCDEGRIRDAIDVLSTVDGDYSLVDRWLRVIDLAARHEDAVILTEDVVRVVEESMGWPAAAEVEYQRLAWDLLLGRTSEYHSGCRELAARYPGDSNSRYLYLTARVASLVTKPGVSTAQLVEMASKANQQFATFWREHACGLCLLRDGQHDAAVERFRQAIAIRKDDAVSDWLGLALAHAAAGRADRAEECLTKAENSIRVYPLDHTSTLHPHDRIACQILYREALRKIRPSADPPPAEGSASEPPSR